jgi:peptide/nickel transport system permease protein
MKTYIAQRILYALVVMFLAATLVFFMLRAIPGDPVAAMLGAEATPQVVAQLRANLGLDKPFVIQYFYWLRNMAIAEMGVSIQNRQKVATLLVECLPRTLSIAFMALCISLLVALPAGIISAVKRRSLADHSVTILAFIGLSMPNFWLGIMLILFLGVKLSWFPTIGYTPLSSGFAPWFKHIFLPSVAAGVPFAAVICRMTRSSLIEVLDELYIATARAKGLSEKVVVLKHALRNALIPIITVIGIAFSLLLVGVVVIEEVFAIQGMGRLLIRGIINRDFPVVQACILVIACTFVFANLFVDILYTIVNPKIRFESHER